MPIASWRRRCSRMAAGKRASMREGPLAALFRKTEMEGLEDGVGGPGPSLGERPAAPSPRRATPEPEAPRIPSPQERLRHAFSSDLPANLMAPPSAEPPPPEHTH